MLDRQTEKWVRKNAATKDDAVAVTPSRASALLAANVDNYRPVRPKRVDQYARPMKAGRWRSDGAPIRFWPDGRLADGQHRLMACIAAGVTIHVILYWGVESDDSMDSGFSRTAGQTFRSRGEKYHNILASICRAGAIYRLTGSFSPSGDVNPSTEEITAFFEDHKEDARKAAEMSAKAQSKTLGGPSHYGFTYFAMAKVDQEKADSFLLDVAGETNCLIGNPARTFRELMANLRHRPAPTYTRACLIFAVNAYMADRDLKTIRYRKTGRSPMEFPKFDFLSPKDL